MRPKYSGAEIAMRNPNNVAGSTPSAYTIFTKIGRMANMAELAKAKPNPVSRRGLMAEWSVLSFIRLVTV
jgi:hypothetical protein